MTATLQDRLAPLPARYDRATFIVPGTNAEDTGTILDVFPATNEVLVCSDETDQGSTWRIPASAAHVYQHGFLLPHGAF